VSLKELIIALALLAFSFPSLSAENACDHAPGKTPVCKSIDEQVQQAERLNAGKRYTEAADLMERVLMQHPDASGAIEQYNRALAGIDGRESKVAKPLDVQLQPSLILSNPWKINTGLQIRGGYSDNLNQAPSQSTIQLTLSSQSIVLPLLPQFRRQAGFGTEAQLTGNAVRTFADTWQWQVRGELFNRQTGYGGYADYQGANLLTSLMRHGEGGSETGVALGLNTLRYGGDIYLYTGQAMLRHTGNKWGYCRPQLGSDLLWQRQNGQPLLDSRYAGLMGGIVCDTPLGWYSAVLSAGWDWASSQRPGGDQRRGRLEVTGIWPTDALIQSSFLKVYTNILQSNDLQTYSPWLSNGATRNISRIGAGLEYDWPLKLVADNWRGLASVKWYNQNSNISLFEAKALEGWVGIRIGW